LDALGQEQCARPHARGRQRRLGAGMAAADDDDVMGARESLCDELMHDYLTARDAYCRAANPTNKTAPCLMLARLMRMRTVLRALGAGALLGLGVNAGPAAAGGLTLSACELEHPLRLTVV